MENRIYHINKKQVKEYLPHQDDTNKVIHIDFKNIKSWKEYAEVMEKELDFPRPVDGSPNRFLDWIRDLTWYNYVRYDIFIYHFSNLSTKNFESAYEIYREFQETILPFWEHEVVHTVVEGKPKKFNVYFVK